MPFIPIILIRILFIASMVFIIGYVFGGFSRHPALVTITRIAAILIVVLFILSNVLFFRFGGWHRGYYHGRNECGYYQKDSVRKDSVRQVW